MSRFLPCFSIQMLLKVAAVLLVLVTGCNYSHGPDPAPQPASCDTTAVTYAGVISPIFDTNCRQCHGKAVYKKSGGSNDLSDYKSIKDQPAGLIVHCIQHDPGYAAMPIGGAKLADCDIERIKAWMAAGQPNN